MTGFDSKQRMAADKFIAAEERKVGERYGYVPKLHPSEWMNAQPAQDPVKHWSDCAVHNGPAYPAGKCDCGVAQEPVTHLWECLGRWSAYLVENGKQADCSPPSWLVDAINKATTPPLPVQEPQYEYLINDLAEWKQYVEVDNAPYGLREHVTKVLLAHGIKEKNT